MDHWISEVGKENLFTIVGWSDDGIVGYATVDRGNACWTRHVAELRVVVAEGIREIASDL